MKRCLGIAVLAALSLAAPAAAQSTAPDPRLLRADSLFIAKDYSGAAAAYASLAKSAPLDPRSRFRYGTSLANVGNYAAAAVELDAIAGNGNAVVLYNAGSVHARLGHPDTAFGYLNASITRGFTNLATLAADSSFASLRNDARYTAAIARMKDAFAPCENNPDSHRFDFWVGEWTVTNAAGQPAGSSSVQKILSNCVVFENWTDAQGGQGKSLNAFNRSLGRWQQFWTDQYGTVTEYRESQWIGASLQYTAQSTSRTGAPTVLRMTFTPIDRNTVRQFGETSTDGGKTFTTSYDLFYRRK